MGNCISIYKAGSGRGIPAKMTATCTEYVGTDKNVCNKNKVTKHNISMQVRCAFIDNVS
jgi:hypothetical protein